MKEMLQGMPINESIIIPILEKEALSKGLELYIYRDEELEEFWLVKNKQIGVALLAANEDNARTNIKALRRCYLINLDQ